MISITVDGKKYSKKAPTVKDWHDHLGRMDDTQDKNFFTDGEMYETVCDAVKTYLDIPAEASLEKVPFANLMKAYKGIQKELVDAMSESQAVWGNVLAAADEPPQK